MTAPVDESDASTFKALFAKADLSKEDLYALDWPIFEDFVKLVFESAGYAVDKVSKYPKYHVDLVLHEKHVGGKVVARVEVRRYQTAKIIKARVQQFNTALIQSGPAPGYIVTTSDFTSPAYDVAADPKLHGRVRLINGEHFLRFIRYVTGTRVLGVGGQPANITQPSILPDALLRADAVVRRKLSETCVLAMANNKGGVAKTTTALNVALVLASKPYAKRVLLVDCDGQKSLTTLLPAPVPASGSRGARAEPPQPLPKDEKSLSDYYAGNMPLSGLIRETRFDNLWLIPADGRLAQLDLNGSLLTETLLDFVRDIHSTSLTEGEGNGFDWIILDTPPAQGFCTRAALAASHFVIMPAQAETLAVAGAEGGLRTALTMRQLTGVDVKVLGSVVTRYRKSAQADERVKDLKKVFESQGSRVFTTMIPADNTVEQGNHATATGSSGLPRLFAGLRLSPAGQAYQNLVKEIL